MRLIAEVKKASPSRGLLCADFDPVRLAETYASNGAAAISVLTDPRFQGEPAHLSAIKESGVSGAAPVLRKDFIFDPYQVYEARAMGADTYLLIVAILSAAQLSELCWPWAVNWAWTRWWKSTTRGSCRTALDAGADIVGINNRDLRTFQHGPGSNRGAGAADTRRQGNRQRERHFYPGTPATAGAIGSQRGAGGRSAGYGAGYGGQGAGVDRAGGYGDPGVGRR